MTPETFEKSLRNYDPALSLRRGPTGHWVVERTERISNVKLGFYQDLANQPNPRPDHVEIFQSALNGRNFVLMTLILGNHVFDQLYKEDLWTHGTEYVDRHMRRLDEEKARKRKDDSKTRQIGDALTFVNRKGWDACRVDEKEKVTATFKEALCEQGAIQKKPQQPNYQEAMKLKQKKNDPTLNKLGDIPKWMLRDSKVLPKEAI